MLGQLSDELFDRLLREARVQELDTGEGLFVQGDEVDAFFIVLDGWVKLYRPYRIGRRGRRLGFHPWPELSPRRRCSPWRHTLSPPTRSRRPGVLRLSGHALQSNVRDDPQFAMSMLASASRHLHELVRQIEQLKTQNGTQRVARFLAGLCPVEEGSCIIGLP